LLILFAFVANKLHEDSTAKKSKRGPKGKKQGITRREAAGHATAVELL